MSGIRVALTSDLRSASGAPSFGSEPLKLLDAVAALEWDFVDVPTGTVTAELAALYDALYVTSARVPASAVAAPDRRLRLVARHGVGFDAVDVAAMTSAGVIVTNTPVAIRRPVATMIMTFVLAQALRLADKDRLAREGGWARRSEFMGRGLTGRTLGLIGFGGIGRETAPLARAFDMQVVTADPWVDDDSVRALGAQRVPLEALLRSADFVVVCCALDDTTRHLIDASRLALMRPSAYLINVARGPIVDERALIDVLQRRAIAGAALDVFEQEPVAPDNPLLAMRNVIVTPHALCWTDQCFDAIAREGLGCVAAFASHRVPASVVNRDVLEHPAVRDWLAQRG